VSALQHFHLPASKSIEAPNLEMLQIIPFYTHCLSYVNYYYYFQCYL